MSKMSELNFLLKWDHLLPKSSILSQNHKIIYWISSVLIETALSSTNIDRRETKYDQINCFLLSMRTRALSPRFPVWIQLACTKCKHWMNIFFFSNRSRLFIHCRTTFTTFWRRRRELVTSANYISFLLFAGFLRLFFVFVSRFCLLSASIDKKYAFGCCSLRLNESIRLTHLCNANQIEIKKIMFLSPCFFASSSFVALLVCLFVAWEHGRQSRQRLSRCW